MISILKNYLSTFSKNYVLHFAETELFEQSFYRILKQATEAGLVNLDVAFVDSIHVKANKHKFHKKLIRKETSVYQEVLEDEINVSRVAEGKKPFARKESKISDTDPESGYYVKGERKNNLLILSLRLVIPMVLF